MTISKDLWGNVVLDKEDMPSQEFIREYMRIKPLYSGALKTACSKFEILDDEFSMLQGHDPIHSIESRLKTVESAYEKLKRRGFEQTPKNLINLMDIAGVRVVCTYIEDIYKNDFEEHFGILQISASRGSENAYPRGRNEDIRDSRKAQLRVDIFIQQGVQKAVRSVTQRI